MSPIYSNAISAAMCAAIRQPPMQEKGRVAVNTAPLADPKLPRLEKSAISAKKVNTKSYKP